MTFVAGVIVGGVVVGVAGTAWFMWAFRNFMG